MSDKNILIICTSAHHGNTMKIAKIIAEVLNAKIIEPKNFDINSLSKYELIGFGSGIYNQKHHKSLFNIVSNLDKQENKKSFIFSTETIPFKGMHKDLRERLIEKGFDIIGDFSCKGFMNYSFTKYIFGGLNKGRPNNKDFKKAREFGRKLKDNIK